MEKDRLLLEETACLETEEVSKVFRTDIGCMISC